MELLRRIWFLFNRSRLERELTEEMEAHRELTGSREFGGSLRLREEAVDAWGWRWLDDLSRDVRIGFRGLRRSPVYVLTAVLILSLGLGVNLAMFQMLNVTALQPLPVKDPLSLVRFHRQHKTFYSSGVPYPATQFHRRHNRVLSAVVTQTQIDAAWEEDGSDRLRVGYVSANFFDELGYGAALGRVFSEAIDEKPSASPVAVFSHETWERRLARDPGAVGKTVRLNGRPVTVAGIVPPNFPGINNDNTQIWLLIDQIDYFNPGADFKQAWRSGNTDMYGRLLPGIGLDAAREGMRASIAELARQRPLDVRPDEFLEPIPGTVRFRKLRDNREMWTAIWLAGGVTLLILLVACSNLSNLVLTRTGQRARELAIRASLGAGRARLARLLLIECAIVTAAGSVGAVVAGYAGARALAAKVGLPSYLDFTPDWRTALFASVLCSVPMLLLGLLPAWRATRRDLTAAVRDGASQTGAALTAGRLRAVLLGSQVFGSCVLLVVAGLMVRHLAGLAESALGFDFSRVAAMDPSLVRHGLNGEAARAYWRDVKEAVSSQPQVEAVAIATHAPLGSSMNESDYVGTNVKVTRLSVEPEFFPLLRIPFLAGRNFERGDRPESAVIVSRRLAERMYGTLDVLGKGFPAVDPSRTIVGVVADTSLLKIHATGMAQEYSPLGPGDYKYSVLVARGRADAAELLPILRLAARRADSRVFANAEPVSAGYRRRTEMPRTLTAVASFAGLLALSLACLGVFGLVSYGVMRRTREIGIRMALGASRRSILASVAGQFAAPISLGSLSGIGAGVAASRLLRGDPFYLGEAGAALPFLVFLLLVASAMAAAAGPAARALGVDPSRALRHD